MADRIGIGPHALPGNLHDNPRLRCGRPFRDCRLLLVLGPAEVDLVAISSPHASLEECQALPEALDGQSRDPRVVGIVTAGRRVLAAAGSEGTRERLAASGVEMFGDLCWCSTTRPVFPVDAKTVITTSGKYAHYGPSLSGCAVRLGTCPTARRRS